MFIIVDKEREGYACNDPLESWIFTTLSYQATKFATLKEAEDCIEKNYKADKDFLTIKAIT